MTLTEFDRRQMLEEFERVHQGLEAQKGRFDHIDDNLASVRAELKQLRTELEDLKEEVDNISVDRKAIAHTLQTIAEMFAASRSTNVPTRSTPTIKT
jgi:septal ring factor EnvC (AmiA/AmiB activator)